MSDGKLDLTGHWSGLYNYPNGEPPVPFVAVLRENAGFVTGMITEASDLFYRFGEILNTVVDGRRDGSSVRFFKMYEADDDYDVAHYEGTLHPDGSEIDGQWEVPGHWSGTFFMIRAGGTEEEIAVKAKKLAGIPI